MHFPAIRRMAVTNPAAAAWDVQNCTVTVNGAGTFGCVMTIQIDRSDFFALTDNQGIFVVETNDEQKRLDV